MPEAALPALIRDATGVDVSRLLRQATEGCEDLPLSKLLRALGVSLTWEADGELPSIGAKVASEGESIKLAQVFTDGPAHAAGLSAGDLLVALDGLRVKAGGLDARLARMQAGTTVSVHAFRRDELFETRLQLAPPPTVKAKLAEDKRAGKPVAALREAWIGRR
ncbi:PDZ domain-containing protein [Niveibacterium sp. COAC-50]|uniref:PDZ domain-containing protein n=1 Tax=Niveibacterium sp. COAC-50 TaxID=2729384 RepID=UPI0035303955